MRNYRGQLPDWKMHVYVCVYTNIHTLINMFCVRKDHTVGLAFITFQLNSIFYHVSQGNEIIFVLK